MGHRLNGFYLVQEKQEAVQLREKLKTVYCDFSSSTKLQFANKNTAGKVITIFIEQSHFYLFY